jgi:hypothetical protein
MIEKILGKRITRKVQKDNVIQFDGNCYTFARDAKPKEFEKRHLSTALGIHAIERGYQVSFVSMEKLIYILKT